MKRGKKTNQHVDAELKHRTATILRRLKSHYGQVTTALNFDSPLQLLVATILSAQCTDKCVNEVTPGVFAEYETAADFADADPRQLEKLIRPTGFFRNKTRSIIGMARQLVADHGGRVPETMDELLELPGVARKTANVVLAYAFGKNEGIAVDTHVRRVSQRLGLTQHNDPKKIEPDLLQLLPRKNWTLFGQLLIRHGRSICTAARPKCDICPVNDLCPSAFTFGN